MNNRLILGVLVSFLLFSACMMGNRPFPKRYLGTYEGTQDPYVVKVNDNQVTVPATDYTLKLAYDELWLTTEKQVIHGRYEVSAETDMYYALTVRMKNGTTEEWQLWKKGKRLIRKEMLPKPEVVFVK
tara:strand:- start:119551 stop:119934 length:384 start_codon:yes stop_codon:yes gene_type:complete